MGVRHHDVDGFTLFAEEKGDVGEKEGEVFCGVGAEKKLAHLVGAGEKIGEGEAEEGGRQEANRSEHGKSAANVFWNFKGWNVFLICDFAEMAFGWISNENEVVFDV